MFSENVHKVFKRWHQDASLTLKKLRDHDCTPRTRKSCEQRSKPQTRLRILQYFQHLIIHGQHCAPLYIRGDNHILGCAEENITQLLPRWAYHRNKTAHHQAAARRGGQNRVLGAPAVSTSPRQLSSPLPTWDKSTQTHERHTDP